MTDFVRNSASCPVSSFRLCWCVLYTVHMYCAVYTCTVVSRPGDSQGSTCHTGQLQTTGGRCAADMNMGPITGS